MYANDILQETILLDNDLLVVDFLGAGTPPRIALLPCSPTSGLNSQSVGCVWQTRSDGTSKLFTIRSPCP